MSTTAPTPPSQLKHIKKAYSADTKTFLLGIKMQLVPAQRTGTKGDHHTKVNELIRLQAHFLKYTETRWISKEIYDLAPQQCPLYDTLWAMRLPLCLGNQSRKPLFHAISPSITNDGYLVCYLPQYWAPVKAAIDWLPKPVLYNTGFSCQQACAQQGSTSSSHQCIIKGPQIHGSIRSVDMITILCTLPPSMQPTPNLPSFCAHSIVFRPALSLPAITKSSHGLPHCGSSFRILWDRWYHNGVSQSWQESPPLAPFQVFYQHFYPPPVS